MLSNSDFKIKNKLSLLKKFIKMYYLLMIKQIKNVALAFCKRRK